MGRERLYEYYTRLYSLVQNRITMVNGHLHACGSHALPMVLHESRGRCDVTLFGRVLVSWSSYDEAGIEDALDVLNVVETVIWDMCCNKMIRYMDV